MEMTNHYQHTYDMCKQHMHSYVLAEMNDGTQVDGIITGLDGECVYMAVPISCGEQVPYSGQAPYGQMPYGQMPYSGQMPYGQMPYSGQTPYGQMSYPGGHQYHNCHQREEDIGGFGYGNPGYGYGSGYGYGYGSGYGSGYGYGYGPGYGHYGRRRRFNRAVLPLAALISLTALPWY
ncbi:hypothetical protein GCM10028778_14510 [Barrientosiimonas marina]|uniref:Spore coat protein n=1 Tax=Lentibacillus kimchii TaxID=1542911 RepID=A0ABW2USL7_9BACI